MTGFEPWPSGIGSNHAVNCATTTATYLATKYFNGYSHLFSLLTFLLSVSTSSFTSLSLYSVLLLSEDCPPRTKRPMGLRHSNEDHSSNEEAAVAASMMSSSITIKGNWTHKSSFHNVHITAKAIRFDSSVDTCVFRVRFCVFSLRGFISKASK